MPTATDARYVRSLWLSDAVTAGGFSCVTTPVLKSTSSYEVCLPFERGLYVSP
jgi:hypothetical protein